MSSVFAVDFVLPDNYSSCMTHTEALNLILSHACPSQIFGEDGYEFVIDTHCTSLRVRANLVSSVDTVQYDILSVEVI